MPLFFLMTDDARASSASRLERVSAKRGVRLAGPFVGM
ncbi:hypothetical protein PLANPX_6019 [Lacipirellula parvula]|uniref:Uncharacterized protein n=1 Tax=Lacipirellula parvula TaxID=2650471 RepID=A0A5K7XJU6_9BACT|nr:hypothetical protein PLANPX_6019 [Lacipirellula parvula]